MTATELCRQRLYTRLGIETNPKRDRDKMAAEITRMKRKLAEIVAIAEPRLVMGGIRYGSDWEHGPLMEYMQTKFDAYRKTGNFEMLIDLVNFIAIEGQMQTHPEYHFEAEDRKE